MVWGCFGGVVYWSGIRVVLWVKSLWECLSGLCGDSLGLFVGLVIHCLCLFTYLYHVLLECPCLLILKVGICMVLEQSLVEVCLKGLNGVVVERGPALAHRCSEGSVVSLRGCSANLMEIEW